MRTSQGDELRLYEERSGTQREDIEALVMHAYQQDEAEEAALGSRRGDELPGSWPGARHAWPKLRPRGGVWKLSQG